MRLRLGILLKIIINNFVHISWFFNFKSSQLNSIVLIFKLNLWGNKCDLSISLGQISEHSTLFDTASLDENILSDYSEDVWCAISDTSSSSDIIGK